MSAPGFSGSPNVAKAVVKATPVGTPVVVGELFLKPN